MQSPGGTATPASLNLYGPPAPWPAKNGARHPQLSGLAAGLLIASVFGDFAGWWLVGAAVLASSQVAAVLILAGRG